MLIDKQKGRPQKTYLPLHYTFSPLILHSSLLSESRSDIHDHFLNELEELIVAVWWSVLLLIGSFRAHRIHFLHYGPWCLPQSQVLTSMLFE